jgi:steroid delta-isomerase-like uncharacterized protein
MAARRLPSKSCRGGQDMRRLLIVATWIAAFYGGSATAADGIAAKWAAAWNSHDPANVVALFAENGVYEDIPFGSSNRGTAALRKYAADYFAAVPDMKTVVTGGSIKNGRGYIEWVFSGTDVGLYKTGKPFSLRGVSIIATKNGKVTSDRDYYDLAALMKQVGASPQ